MCVLLSCVSMAASPLQILLGFLNFTTRKAAYICIHTHTHVKTHSSAEFLSRAYSMAGKITRLLGISLSIFLEKAMRSRCTFPNVDKAKPR